MNPQSDRMTFSEVQKLFAEAGLEVPKWTVRRWLQKHHLRTFGPTKRYQFWERAAVMAAFNRDMNPQLAAA